MAVDLDFLYKQWLNSFVRIFNPTGSNYEAYVKAFLQAALEYIQRIDQFGDNLSITNANESTLDLWETFLNLPRNQNFSPQYRKGRLIATTAGYPPSLENIAKLIQVITNSGSVVIHELGNPEDAFYNPAHPFDVHVVITITGAEILVNFDPNEAEQIIDEFFPAHTNVTYTWNMPVEFQIHYAPVDPGQNEGEYDDFESVYA